MSAVGLWRTILAVTDLFAAAISCRVTAATLAVFVAASVHAQSDGGQRQAGIRVGALAPEFTLSDVDNTHAQPLSGLRGKPTVLVFGSCTCPPFVASTTAIDELYAKYRLRANFLMVYIKEAHPIDGRQVPGVAFRVVSPKTTAERCTLARAFDQTVEIDLPIVVDTIDDAVSRLYSPWPNRMVIIDAAGVVVDAADAGPQATTKSAARASEVLDALLAKTAGAPAAQTDAPAAERTPVERSWTIDGIERKALVSLPMTAPTDTEKSPIVFIFHGHGGNARQVRRSYQAERHWPEAIFVYPQGLPTPGALTDPEGKRAGWQSIPGMLGDRDLKLFDAILASLKSECQGDADRVFAAGHSNGGGFTYLLWSQRHADLAAVAPSSAYGRIGTLRKPLPAMHIAGRNDPLVKFDRQERTMEEVRKIDGCAPEGTRRGDRGMYFASATGTPVLLWISDSTHKFDQSSVEPMIGFFFAQRRNDG